MNSIEKAVRTFAGKSVRQLNPEFYGSPLDTRKAPLVQHDAREAPRNDLPPGTPVDAAHGRSTRRRTRKPVLRVLIVIVTRGEFDSDNWYSATKHTRDRIAAEFGLDDNDRTIRWEYGWAGTRGAEGVMVKIEPFDA